MQQIAIKNANLLHFAKLTLHSCGRKAQKDIQKGQKEAIHKDRLYTHYINNMRACALEGSLVCFRVHKTV